MLNEKDITYLTEEIERKNLVPTIERISQLLDNIQSYRLAVRESLLCLGDGRSPLAVRAAKSHLKTLLR